MANATCFDYADTNILNKSTVDKTLYSPAYNHLLFSQSQPDHFDIASIVKSGTVLLKAAQSRIISLQFLRNSTPGIGILLSAIYVGVNRVDLFTAPTPTPVSSVINILSDLLN